MSYIIKAQAKDAKEWVKGYLWKGNDKAFVIPYTAGVDVSHNTMTAPVVEINPNTICKPTEKYNNKDQMIYEHDILFVNYPKGYDGPPNGDVGVGEVLFLDGMWYVHGTVQEELFNINKKLVIETIGNRIDNPELVSKGHDEPDLYDLFCQE